MDTKTRGIDTNLNKQASEIVNALSDYEELCWNDKEQMHCYLKGELWKAFESGQRAALEYSGQQVVLF